MKHHSAKDEYENPVQVSFSQEEAEYNHLMGFIGREVIFEHREPNKFILSIKHPEQTPSESVSYDAMGKGELLTLAGRKGVPGVDARFGKAKIIAAIRNFDAENAE